MRKLWITGVAILMLFLLSACGGAEESPAEETASTEAPATAPIPTDTPVPATEAVQATEEPTMVAAAREEPEEEAETAVSAKLQAYADENANGPGAIFVGDFGQLAGAGGPIPAWATSTVMSPWRQSKSTHTSSRPSITRASWSEPTWKTRLRW